MEDLNDIKDLVIGYAARLYVEKTAFTPVQSALMGTAFQSAAMAPQDLQRYHAILGKLDAATGPKTAADKKYYDPRTGVYGNGGGLPPQRSSGSGGGGGGGGFRPGKGGGTRLPSGESGGRMNGGSSIGRDQRGNSRFDDRDEKYVSSIFDAASKYMTEDQRLQQGVDSAKHQMKLQDMIAALTPEDARFDREMADHAFNKRVQSAKDLMDSGSVFGDFWKTLKGDKPTENMGRQLLQKTIEPAFAAPANALSKVLEEHALHKFGPEKSLGEKKDPLSMGGTEAVREFGKSVGDIGGSLLKDIVSKAITAAGGLGAGSARKAILQELRKNDPILSQTSVNEQTLMDAYHTMVKFAPTLASDKNAVRSFLRTAVQGGGGVDFNTIRLIADAEKTVNSSQPPGFGSFSR